MDGTLQLVINIGAACTAIAALIGLPKHRASMLCRALNQLQAVEDRTRTASGGKLPPGG